MKNKSDYSKYKCPYSYLDKECGHELKGPEGYENIYSIWCECGFRGPVFYLDPEQLGLQIIEEPEEKECYYCKHLHDVWYNTSSPCTTCNEDYNNFEHK